MYYTLKIHFLKQTKFIGNRYTFFFNSKYYSSIFALDMKITLNTNWWWIRLNQKT